jgi:catechol 2,3-dioxygenase-like lactoylglutathione lyase family enzyme
MIKGICIDNIAIDCKDAVKLRNFYAELLGLESCIMYNLPALRSQLGLVLFFKEADFEYVKPVWPEEIGKQQKQMHFGFQVDDLPTAVVQAEALGACKAERQFGGNYLVTMFDPEGHPFCLSAK